MITIGIGLYVLAAGFLGLAVVLWLKGGRADVNLEAKRATEVATTPEARDAVSDEGADVTDADGEDG